MLEREQRALRRLQIEWTYRPAPLAILSHIVAAAIVAAGMHTQVPFRELMLWFLLLAGVQLLWGVAVIYYGQTTHLRKSDERWLQFHFIATSLNGLIWGIGTAYVLFPLDSLFFQTLLLVIVAVVATGGLYLNRNNRMAGALFVLSVMLPMVVRCFHEAGAYFSLLGILLLAYTGMLLFVQYQYFTGSIHNLWLERDNNKLQREKSAYQSYFNRARHIAALGSWNLDMHTGELNWSSEAYGMFGIEPGTKLTKQVVLSAIYWADRQPFIRTLEEAIRDRTSLERQFRVMLPDGGLRVVLDTAELILDDEGEPERMLGVMCDISGKVNAEQQTKTAYQELNRIINNMQDTYYRADPAGRLTQVSPSMSKLLGYSQAECLGMRIADLYAVASHGKTYLQDLHTRGGRLHNYDVLMMHKDGQRVWVSLNAQFIFDDKGKTIGIEGTVRDISELKQAREALYQEKELALVTLQSIGDGVITTDESGNIRYINPTAEKLLGFRNERVVGKYYHDVMQLVNEGTGEKLEDMVRLCLSLDTGSALSDEGLLLKPDGSSYNLKVTSAPMRNHNGHVVGAVLVLHDITEVMGMARQLSYQASHDMLTGLYNRRVFEQRVEEAIRTAYGKGEVHALFYMDLDQFKVVNDTCGHNAGDELLQQVAALMQDKIRDTDVLARLGGDEFGVLLEHCTLEHAVEIADKLRASVRDFRFIWEDKAFDIGVSIGVLALNGDSGNMAHALAAADAACYIAKDGGRNRIHVYQPDDEAIMQHHGEMQWVHRISTAFDSDSFELYAQPVAHLAEGRVFSHYEILVRMKDEQGRVIPPGAFIPAAERYNQMPNLDRWVIRKALEMLKEAQGDLAFPPVEVAINLSGKSLTDDTFLEYVVDLFDVTGVPCENVSFEVTETAAVANLSRATRFISVLRGMGCSFALDDFGAGLSSFGYLKTLPIDYLKIDGSFVRDMVIDQVDRAMVESINEIGHIMGLKTIGEYAEDEDVVQALQRAGVDFAQGNGIGAPIPFSDVLHEETRQLRMSSSADTMPANQAGSE